VAQGFKNKEMAERMFISEQTVKNHLHNIFDKLGVSDRLELALYDSPQSARPDLTGAFRRRAAEQERQRQSGWTPSTVLLRVPETPRP
jgi:hypothetical protein